MPVKVKAKLLLYVRQARHFLAWERRHFAHYFELVDEPGADVVIFAFGPDVLEAAAELPARRRVAMLFPGFGHDPYHNLEYRRNVLETIDRAYDLLIVNPGPLQVAYASCPKLEICHFSVDVDRIAARRYRKQLDSLIHVSADYPHKDWRRSERVMQLTGLRHEVFPPRGDCRPSLASRFKHHANRAVGALGMRAPFSIPSSGYVDHYRVIRKYEAYDGFVHVAAEVADPRFLDGQYTACLMEAGLTGAILFWHDTLSLGNTLETVFTLPLEPEPAAQRILEIRGSLNVETHSRRTREEMLETFNPKKSVTQRCLRIKELL